MTVNTYIQLDTAHALSLDKVPQVAPAVFRAAVIQAVRAGARVSALFGVPEQSLPPEACASPCADKALRIFAVLADDENARLCVLSMTVERFYQALTPECPQAHWFERELYEQWGVMPEGHPWLKPVRFHRCYRAGQAGAGPCIGITDFFRLDGAEVHEVAVGPVHAGIIEPGHFRFQCHGEDVYHLEISLGYQHRGIEPALAGGANRRTLHYMETLAGDTSIGHATAYAQAMEALAGCRVQPRALALRGIALELERAANHTGDLGALAGDVGYLPTASFCGRIRGDFLNMTALLCGSRFGRGLVSPGGVLFDAQEDRLTQLLERLRQARKDVETAVNLLWDTPSVMARFEGTGTLEEETAQDLGLVGPAARASGLVRDCRYDFPAGIFRFAQIPVSTWGTGDVFARAYVRWLELQRSLAFIESQIETLPAGDISAGLAPVAPGSLVVSLVEGWRGEICHVAITDGQGGFSRYKIVDPSFHNWPGLAFALRGQQISDFPLCNKSFNLSYCGHDL
jgi:Ni,Fe-hydrogenase III large subunit